MNNKKLPDVFVSYAADILGDTQNGMTGGQIVKLSNSYAVDFGVLLNYRSFLWNYIYSEKDPIGERSVLI